MGGGGTWWTEAAAAQHPSRSPRAPGLHGGQNPDSGTAALLLFLLPNILLSGFIFPREAMPAAAQWLGALLPLTYYLRILRGILLRGVGPAQLWAESLLLLGFALVLVILSVRRFSKTIE
jgi:drug efflux transport system permease protein